MRKNFIYDLHEKKYRTMFSITNCKYCEIQWLMVEDKAKEA